MPTKVTPEYTPYLTRSPMGPRDPTEHVRVEFPEVRISDAVGRAMRSTGEGFQTLAGAHGAIAHAFDNLGSQLEKTGNQLWDRAQGLQELQNQNQLSKAELEFDKYVATRKAQFDNLKGEAATEDTYKAYVKDLEQQQKKLGEKLPPRTLEQFNKSTLNQIGRAGIAAAGHVASEIRSVTVATSEARVNQWKDELSKTQDLNRTKELIDLIEKEVHGTQRPVRGWSAEQANEATRKHVGEGYIGQLKDLARTDPWQAIKILEHPENKGLWDDKQYLATKEHILNEMTRIGSRNIGNEVQDHDPDASLDDKLKDGDRRADAEEKRTGQKLPDIREATRQKIKERHHTHKEMVAEERRKNIEIMDGVLSGNGASANGNKPKNIDELFTYGGQAARDAYEKLNETDRKKVDKELNKIAMGLTDPTSESENARLQLWGLRETDPARFRDMDLSKVDDLRMANKLELEKEQKRLRSGEAALQSDPRIGKALSDATKAGAIEKSITPSNPTKWRHFHAVFREAIYAAQKAKGFDKPLTEEENVAIAKMVQNNLMKGKGWFGREVDVTLLEGLKSVPKEVTERLRTQNPNITDDAILSEYRREVLLYQWEKRFKGTK